MWYAGKIFKVVVAMILLFFCCCLLCAPVEGSTIRNTRRIASSIHTPRGCLHVRRYNYRYAYRRYRMYRDRISNRPYSRACGWRVRRGRYSTPIRLKNSRISRYNRLHAGRVIVYEKGKRPYVR